MKRFYTLATAMAFGAAALMAQTMIVVDKSDNQYRIGVDRIAQITFEEAEEAPVRVTPTSITDYGYGNVLIEFTGVDTQQVLSLDIYGPATATYLMAGSYIVDDAGTDYTIGISYSRYQPEALDNPTNTLKPKSGKMDVADNDRVYTIDIDIVMNDDSQFKATYTGELSSYTSKPVVPQAKEVELSNCRIGFKNDLVAGEFYLKLNDSAWNYEGTLDVFADAAATSLPEGTYTLSQSAAPAAGSLGYTSSSIDIYDASVESGLRGNSRFKEATLTVSKSGDIYTLVLDAVLENDLAYKMTYTGEIN